MVRWNGKERNRRKFSKAGILNQIGGFLTGQSRTGVTYTPKSSSKCYREPTTLEFGFRDQCLRGTGALTAFDALSKSCMPRTAVGMARPTLSSLRSGVPEMKAVCFAKAASMRLRSSPSLSPGAFFFQRSNAFQMT